MSILKIFKAIESGLTDKEIVNKFPSVKSVGGVQKYKIAYKLYIGKCNIKRHELMKNIYTMKNSGQPATDTCTKLEISQARYFQLYNAYDVYIRALNESNNTNYTQDTINGNNLDIVKHKSEEFDNIIEEILKLYSDALLSIDMFLDLINHSKDFYDKVGEYNIKQQIILHEIENARDEKSVAELSKELYKLRKDRRVLKTQNLLSNQAIKSFKYAGFHSDQLKSFRDNFDQHIKSIRDMQFQIKDREDT